MKNFFSKNRKQLFIYLIGFLLLTAFIYISVLRHQGYIFFWDLSGAFDFRDPFGQYFKMYTPWDGITIGIKNRMPLVSIIYLIFLPIKYIFNANNEAVIKIAVYLLFIGSYTVMYFLFPRFLKIFQKNFTVKHKEVNIWALIIALLYCFIPFFTYRIPQLNMFYMTIFYPIHIYLFLLLLEQKRIRWKVIIPFIISMFFGLTSPNIIVFDLITFVIFFVIKIIQLRKSPKDILKVLPNLSIAAVGVVIVNLYWLIPYFLEGSPTPGYVITQSVVDMLSQGVTLPNFLLGQSDWFLGQGNLGVLDTEYSSVAIVQLLGCVIFYIVALIGLFKYFRKELRFSIIILLLIGPLLILDFIPFHDQVFQFLVFSRFGWVFREINRLSFFWYFWMFILFGISLYSIYEETMSNETGKKFMKILMFPIILIPFIVYLIPINVEFFKYLKPVEINQDILDVFNFLEEDDDFYSVYYYPRIESYSIDWKEERFEIADVVDYLFLTYNSPKPPVYKSTVIANAKSSQTLMTEYLFDNKDKYIQLGKNLNNIGVKYVVIRKDAYPIVLDEDYYVDEILIPTVSYLDDSEEFEIVLENENYILYENKSFSSGVIVEENVFYSTESFNILEHINSEDQANLNIKFCNLEENQEACYQNEGNKKILKFEDNEYFYIDFIPEELREEYGVYIYDHVYDHKIGVDWGRGSMYDKVNGELHNVFRNYGLDVWNFDLVDKFVYSDNPVINEDTASIVSFTENTKCIGDCEVYIFILENSLGGNLTVDVEDLHETIDINSHDDNFKWRYLGDIESDGEVKIDITNEGGFAAIGGILILPRDVVLDALEQVSQYQIIDISIDAVTSLDIDTPTDINIESYDYTPGLIPTLTIETRSSDTYFIRLKSFISDIFVKEADENWGNVSTSESIVTQTGENTIQVLMIGASDIMVWVLFILDALFIVVLLLFLL